MQPCHDSGTHVGNSLVSAALLTALAPSDIKAVIETGLVTGRAKQLCEVVSAENDRLWRENAAMGSQVAVLEATHYSDRELLREALEGRLKRWRLWMGDKPNLWQGVVIGFGVGGALMAVAYEVARWFAG